MKGSSFIFCLLILISGNSLFGKPVASKWFIHNKDWNFEENKGQLAQKDVKYYGHQGGVYLYCKASMLSFVFTKTETINDDKISETTGQDVSGVGVRNSEPLHRKPLQTTNISASRTDLLLIGSNPNAQMIATDQQEYYENYYIKGSTDSGITNVYTYKTITYKNIYRHINLILHSREEGFEYEFIVYPGGKVSDIKLQWNGLQNIKKNKNSGIEYSCSLGKFTESAPYAYVGAGFTPALSANAPITGDRKGSPYPVISSHFYLKNNQISFKTGKYNKCQTLIIDPTLVWSTYFGGNRNDYAEAVACDDMGNVYITGCTASVSGIATAGAFQSTYSGVYHSYYQGDYNIFLAKFNPLGKLLWATYFGDSSSAEGITLDKAGNVYISGETTSKLGIATSGSFQSKYNGPTKGVLTGDAFIVKFNKNGNRVWGTYFGGLKGDYTTSRGIGIDVQGNIYFSGETTCAAGIATSGAYQTQPPSSSVFRGLSPYIEKFSSDGIRIWGTYYGYDTLAKILQQQQTDVSGFTTNNMTGDLYVCGTTMSSHGIATKGAYQDSINFSPASSSGYLAKFNSAGSIQWATYYGSSQPSSVKADDAGNVYMAGTAENDTSIASSGAYQASCAGGTDAFLTKFNTAGKRLWATFYGGPLYDAASRLSTDPAGNVYMTGYTTSKSGIATPGSYQISFSGDTDAFLAKFSSLGGLAWSTYYGSNHCTEAQAICTDISGNIYMAGVTRGDSGIATRGAWQPHYSGGTYDAFLARFGNHESDAGIDSFFFPVKDICAGIVPVKIFIHNFGTKYLDSVKIFLSFNNKTQSYTWKGKLPPDSLFVFSFGSFVLPTGADTLKAWTSLPNGVQDSFPFNDTVTEIINVYAPPKAAFGYVPQDYVFQNNPVSFQNQSTNSISYSWNFGNGDSSNTNAPVYEYQDTGDYKVRLIAKGADVCPNDTAYASVHINSNQAKIYIPNAFSPNGDGLNDVFDLSGFAIKSYSYDIFNRWDERIFHGSANLNEPIAGQGKLSSGAGWDGTFKGVDAPNGTYIYQFDVIDIEGGHHKFRGKLILTR